MLKLLAASRMELRTLISRWRAVFHFRTLEHDPSYKILRFLLFSMSPSDLGIDQMVTARLMIRTIKEPTAPKIRLSLHPDMMVDWLDAFFLTSSSEQVAASLMRGESGEAAVGMFD